MPDCHHTLDVTATDKIGRIRRVLEQHHFTNQQICQLLGVSEIPPPTQRRRLNLLFRYRTRGNSPIENLIRLFQLQQVVSLDAARRGVQPMSVDDWVDVGLLRVRGDAVIASVELVPYQEYIVAADWTNCSNSIEPVMGVAASSRTLAELALWRRKGDVLDLGTGCGVLALLAAAHQSDVTAVDCNCRAIHFARFNAQLNRSTGIAWRTGDFFEPVGGKLFDLILCNPPFVIGPQIGASHSHAGRPVDRLCEILTRSAPSYLQPGGCFQMVLNWADVVGEDWRVRLSDWCRESECDALLVYSHIQDAAEYALARIDEVTDDARQVAEHFDRWTTYYEKERIRGIGFGLLSLRRRPRAANWFDCQRFLAGEELSGDAIRQRFARRDFLQEHMDDELLLNVKLQRTPLLRWKQSHELVRHKWALTESHLEVGPGRSPMAADPEVFSFINWCVGQRPLADYIQRLPAVRKSVQVRADFLNLVRRLVEVGILEPVSFTE